MHDRKICHRDLKLENILVSSKGKTSLLKITDFGLSKQFSIDNQMKMNSFVGTKMYMAPEVVKQGHAGLLRAEQYTDKADMWSLGKAKNSIHASIGLYQSQIFSLSIVKFN